MFEDNKALELNIEEAAAAAGGGEAYFEDGALYYVTSWGDALSVIALSFGTTVENIMALNPDITDPNFIRTNQRIRIY